MSEAMNDNERLISKAEGQPTTEACSSVGSDFNEARPPDLSRPPGSVLRRQIEIWVNEGGADEKKN